jgi:hypothetical protein
MNHLTGSKVTNKNKETKITLNATIALWTCVVWTSVNIFSHSARFLSAASNVSVVYIFAKLSIIYWKSVLITLIINNAESAGWYLT